MDIDVFLSHNSRDKPTVERIGKRLESRELRVWLDVWHLTPGQSWQRELSAAIETSKAAAVFIGKDGLGPWETPEMEAFLDLAAKEGRPVVPVLLPGAPREVEVPLFLRRYTWVDLRQGIDDAGIDQLCRGVQSLPSQGGLSRLRLPGGRPRFLGLAVVLAALLVGLGWWQWLRPASDGLAEVFRHLEEQDFTPNEGLLPFLEPGTLIQVAEGTADGGVRRLATPIRLARAAECFPDQQPDSAPFPLAIVSGTSNASVADLAKLFSTLGLEGSEVTRYRLEFGETKVLSFTQADLSGRFAEPCLDALDQVRDRLEQYAIVLETVVAEGLRLEVDWVSGVSEDVRSDFEEQARGKLTGGKTVPDLEARNESRTVIASDDRIVLGYRPRPLEPDQENGK